MALKHGQDTAQALRDWVGWARRRRLEPFVKPQRSIVKHWDAIAAADEHGLSNGLVESMNTKIRLISAWPSASRTPPPSSPSPCSASADTGPTYRTVKPHKSTHGSDRRATFFATGKLRCHTKQRGVRPGGDGGRSRVLVRSWQGCR